MMALVGTLSFNFQVLMPLLASQTWHGTAATYALLTAAMAVGSVVGALAAGARGRVSPRILVGAATGFGALELLAAAAPSLPLQVARADPAGRDDRDLLGGRQLDDAARRRAGHARARDGAVLGRLPGLDPDRRAARRLAGRGRGPARRDGARRDAPRWPRPALASAAYARTRERQVATAARRGVESRRVLVDLHAHYPMHLVPPEQADTKSAILAQRPDARWKAILVDLLSRRLNYQGPKGAPSVTVELMRAGDVGAVLSVLYSPLDEMDLRPALRLAAEARATSSRSCDQIAARRGPRRDRAAGRDRGPRRGGARRRHRRGPHGDRPRIEGGFALGATPAEIDANVAELARRGVAYVTLAHLFWRGVATNAPALPFLPDWLYRLVFPRPRSG